MAMQEVAERPARRYKTKDSNNSSSIQLDHGNNEMEEANEIFLSSNSETSFVCGKVCKGNRGLNPIQARLFLRFKV